ncbi:hypothetical protein [Streptomyces cremeus]|uniref:hypothetical protein n=1 Tax=Streptomyces cremeus TaxID=66881 RepID=UPI003CD0879A
MQEGDRGDGVALDEVDHTALLVQAAVQVLAQAVQPLAVVPLEVLFRTAVCRVHAGAFVVGVRGLLGEQFAARRGVQEAQAAVRRRLHGEAAVDQAGRAVVGHKDLGGRWGGGLSSAPGVAGSTDPEAARTRTACGPQGSAWRTSLAVRRSRAPARMVYVKGLPLFCSTGGLVCPIGGGGAHGE